jgi:hypothetical protein
MNNGFILLLPMQAQSIILLQFKVGTEFLSFSIQAIAQPMGIGCRRAIHSKMLDLRGNHAQRH